MSNSNSQFVIFAAHEDGAIAFAYNNVYSHKQAMRELKHQRNSFPHLTIKCQFVAKQKPDKQIKSSKQ